MTRPASATRLAPSPTGALHLGNARTFLITWALARQHDWRLILRIEDLDGPRIKPGAAEATVDTLRWLGLDWDEGPLIQSDNQEPYRQAMQVLASKGLAYPCDLTRTEIEAAAAAPQEGSGEVRFPESLRPEIKPRSFDNPLTNWRFVTPPGRTVIADAFAGEHEFEVSKTIGDFVIWTRRGQAAYQLAVVVDDHRQGVTHVVRGDDLLESAARQRLIYGALGLEPLPRWVHLPLVRGSDGRRLAKRHGDTRLDAYRGRGVEPERVVALLARWCGLGPLDRMTAREFQQRLDLSRIPRDPIVFTPEDDAWLLEGR